MMSAEVDNTVDAGPVARRGGLISIRVCAFMLVLYALYFARSLAVPIVTAMVVYLVLRPIVRHGSRIGIPPSIGAIGTMLGILVLLGLGTYLVIQPAQEIIADTPRHLVVVKEKLSFITERLRAVDAATEELAETAEAEEVGVAEEETPVPVEIKQANWASNLSYLSGTGNIVSFLTICGALLYFLLATGDDLLRSIMRTLPSFTARRRLIEVIQNVQEGLGSYLAQVSVINAGLGVAVGTAMGLLGMPSPIVWGVMAFAFNFIPMIGAVAGACIIFVTALVNFEATYYAFVVTGTFLTLTSIEGQFLTPAILGRSMSMSPVLVFLSIVIWGWMWGLMGVFLSIPILIAMRMACEGFEGLTPLATILGAESTDHEPQTNKAAETQTEKCVVEVSTEVVSFNGPSTT
ncbi:pheromone autoinducer 2 transporter [Novipirellula galeiformis]|uniref:Pheromone autoinducer 2 transporter n=1 Tax=Novipirellula galeiformis TaxID=2528004 RepID=A0A5C6CGE6_9BACT|nr:AI-2E family transporter [Novipirellula galeiformis]TWU22316.1 pheromone autoinducer 2 transporter [Novipirellula galeiformis]